MISSWRVVIAVLAWHLAAGAAQAMNWEGHEEWVHLPAIAETSGFIAPNPAAEPLPSCSSRDAETQRNAYAQIPLSGVNCREDWNPKQ
jgi:hypothetical protein